MNKFDKLEKKVPMPKGGKVKSEYPTGGVEIPNPKTSEIMAEKRKGQKGMPKKVRIAKWY